jgi:hypothetical protein
VYFTVFCGALGVLVVLYALHFRHRAKVLGPERIEQALARSMSEEGELPTREEVAEGATYLRKKLSTYSFLCLLSFLTTLAGAVVLSLLSLLRPLAFLLYGASLLAAAASVSFLVIRDILPPG